MLKIAIVDDEQDVLNIIERALKKLQNVEILKFTDPSRAIEDAIRGRFDLVLCDIMMPQMNGLDFLKVLRFNNPKVKIIMMTAYSTQDKVLDAHHFGADDYLTKPFISLRDVELKVRDVLEIE
jgi:DNA-binding response OmpR family regulator